jgi:hypothetical protein
VGECHHNLELLVLGVSVQLASGDGCTNIVGGWDKVVLRSEFTIQMAAVYLRFR